MSVQKRNSWVVLTLAVSLTGHPVSAQTLGAPVSETARIDTAGPLAEASATETGSLISTPLNPTAENRLDCDNCPQVWMNEIGRPHVLTHPRWGTTTRSTDVGRASFQGGTAQSSSGRSWPARHPVLVGALTGMGLGVVIATATFPEPHNPDVTLGMYATGLGIVGAGAGALMGFGISFLLR